MQNKDFLLGIIGPTATGKTEAAILIAQNYNVEIVSADASQTRIGMEIGTAAPTVEQQSFVRHHFISFIEPDSDWNIKKYVELAGNKIEHLNKRNRIPLLVGGSGLYAWSLLEGRSIPEVEPNLKLRQKLEKISDMKGHEYLFNILRKEDPVSAQRIDPLNVRRVVRALEIIRTTGSPVKPIQYNKLYNSHLIALEWPEATLSKRIEERVHFMYANGFIEEVKELLSKYGAYLDAFKSIGYQEVIAYINNNITLDASIEMTIQSTKRFSKMQNRWFKKNDSRIKWIPGDKPDILLEYVGDIISKELNNG
jgi:tRNA dimethylallyltransferase